MKGKLNVFQRSALFWNKTHPYNAVHIARIPLPFEHSRIEEIINYHLENLGITGLRIDPARNNYEYKGGPANIQIKIIESGKNCSQTISREVEEQINSPFLYEDQAITPFRFFVIKQEDSFFLGLVYFHVVAGADSIIFLLKNIVNCYMNNKIFIATALSLYPDTYRKLLPSKLKCFADWLYTLPDKISSTRRTFKSNYQDQANHNNGFTFFTIDSKSFGPVVKTAENWGVTVNDVFLGLVIMALSPLTEKRHTALKRNHISIASIVNIRKKLRVTTPGVFGIFLGYFSVSHRVPKGIGLKEIAQDIREQTNISKKQKGYLKSIIDHFFALKLLSRLTPKRQDKFYSKYFPLSAGITNVNLDPLWKQTEEHEPIDYIRAVSTGPVSPLVFSFTTVNHKLNIGLSYRTTVYSQHDINSIVENFQQYSESAFKIS